MSVIIGVDPGASTTGIGVLWIDPLQRDAMPHLIQCDTAHAVYLIGTLIESFEPARVGVEKWDTTRRTTRMTNAKDRATTQDLIAVVANVQQVQLISRGASKAFATDARLKAIHPGVMRDATGMRHARDGLRVALWTAVNNGLCPDPLSKAWKAKAS